MYAPTAGSPKGDQRMGFITRCCGSAQSGFFKTGPKYAADFKKNMTIQFDKFLPTWNYRAILEAG